LLSEVALPRTVAVAVVATVATLLALLAGGAWGYGDDVCEGLARLRPLTARVGDVRACTCAFFDSLRRPEADSFVFDVAGDRGFARVIVRSSFDVDAGVTLFRAITVITRDEELAVAADVVEAL
jgi:hypothetical protein